MIFNISGQLSHSSKDLKTLESFHSDKVKYYHVIQERSKKKIDLVRGI